MSVDDFDDIPLAEPAKRPLGDGLDALARAAADLRSAEGSPSRHLASRPKPPPKPEPTVPREPQPRRAVPGEAFASALLYPFTLEGLGAAIPMALWSAIAGGFWGLLMSYGVQAGLLGVRALLPPCAILSVIAYGYGAACCLLALGGSSNRAPVDDWPSMADWKDWAGVMLMSFAVVSQLALAAFLLTCWMPWGNWPTIGLTLLLLPVALLAAGEAETLTPWSPPVFSALVRRPGAWLLFHLQWLVLLGVLGLVTWLGVVYGPGWWFLAVSGPLLSVGALMASRRLGRVAADTIEVE